MGRGRDQNQLTKDIFNISNLQTNFPHPYTQYVDTPIMQPHIKQLVNDDALHTFCPERQSQFAGANRQ